MYMYFMSGKATHEIYILFSLHEGGTHEIYIFFHLMRCNKSYSLQTFYFFFLFILYKIYLRREVNPTFCCVMFDSQFCPLAVEYKNLAAKYK